MSESPEAFTEQTGPNAPVDKSTAAKDAVAPVDGPSHAERAAQILGTARATLARSRANDEQFRERPADVTGASGRSRSRPLARRDRTQPPQTPDTSIPTWEQEREAVFEAIRGLRQFCETLSDQLAAIRWRQLGSVFDTPAAAFSEMKRWANAEAPLGQTRAGDATASQSATLNGDYTKPADGAT